MWTYKGQIAEAVKYVVLRIYFFILCLCVCVSDCMCVCLSACMRDTSLGGQKRGLHPLELMVQVVVSHHEGAGN